MCARMVGKGGFAKKNERKRTEGGVGTAYAKVCF